MSNFLLNQRRWNRRHPRELGGSPWSLDLMTSGRSHLGCWTCRLRRKKCDEATPTCTSCEKRDLPCHGYGAKPAWFDGGEREREELTKIKTAVKLSLKRRRVSESHHSRPPSPGATSGTTPHPLSSFPEGRTLNPIISNEVHRIGSYREAELLMHYIDYVFPLQFRFHTHASSSRGWLFWLLISTGPLYHAALSLSALHQHSLSETRDVGTELTVYHLRALADLHKFVADIGEGDVEDIGGQLQILACGVSLISFQLFRGGSEDWRPHLDALTSLPAAQHPDSWRSSFGRPQVQDWQRDALLFLVSVTTWFDLLSCASTGNTPRVPYQHLLGTEPSDLQGVMGCDDRVMVVIGDLAYLHAWKLSQHEQGMLSIPQLVSRSRDAETLLHSELEKDSISATTRVFAAGALVYLHTIVSGAHPALSEIQQSVETALASIEAIHDHHEIRGLVWPLCISACLADARLRPRFEAIISRVIAISNGFGNCDSVLKIAQAAWRIQDANKSRAVDWRSAMDEEKTHVLLV